MPSFITALQALAGNDAMSEVNYISINENQKEFIRQDIWDFDIIRLPRAVYYPGNALFKSRLTAVDFSIPMDVSAIDHRIRAFNIHQATNVNTNGTMTWNMIDREDQALTIFVDDWFQKLSDRDNRFSFRKEDTFCDATHTIYNSSRIPVRTLKFFTCQPTGRSMPESGNSEDATGSLSEISLDLNFEHYSRIFNNI